MEEKIVTVIATVEEDIKFLDGPDIVAKEEKD